MSSWRCNFDIVDIAMWMMYTRYHVNIVYIDVLSCLHRRHRNVNDVYTILCQHRLHRCTILFTSSTSRCDRCIHDIVSTSFTSMYYPVYIVDIVMWPMYTRYRVNIVYIDILSCGHRRHCDVNDVYTIPCQHRSHRCIIVFISSTAIHEMNRNFGLFCLFVVGRDVLSMGVPQSVNTYHLRGVTTKTQVYASNFA